MRMVTDALGTTVREGRRAIVYDSSTLLLRLCQGLLAQAGIETTTTNDVNVLADRCTREQFNLVVLDPMLPSLRGGRMTEIRRRIGKVPLVLHSNASADALKAAMAEHTATDWVRKGSFADVLLAKLSAVATAPVGIVAAPKIAAPKLAAPAKPRAVSAVAVAKSEEPSLSEVVAETPTIEAPAATVPSKKGERYNTDKILAMERERGRKKVRIALTMVAVLVAAGVYFAAFRPAPAPESAASAPAHE